MKLVRGLATLGILALTVAALAGCGGSGDVLRVGTEATFPPFEFTDDDENIIGFDIDIIEYIAEDNGWEIEVVHLPFDTLVDTLAAGQLDIVIAGMTIDPERQESVLFSDPYYDASQVMVVREDESRNFDVEDLPDGDFIVAVQMGTTGALEAADIMGDENHPNLKQYRRVNEAFMELKNGRADVVIIDEPVAKNYIQQLGGMKVYGAPFTDEQFGIAVQLDNEEMAEKINASLDKMKSSGHYDDLISKWFED